MYHLIKLIPLLTLVGCSASRGEEHRNISSPYAVTAVGRIDAASEARQLVAEADGIIDIVLVERGSKIVAGQPLLKIACADRRSDLGRDRALARRAQQAAALVMAGARSEAVVAAEAQLLASEVRLRDSEQRYQQVAPLLANGFVSQREFDARANARDISRTEVEQSAAQLATLRQGARPQERAIANAEADAARLTASATAASNDQCILRSPVSGTVLQILRRSGEFSGASQGVPLIVVGDMSQLIVRAEINERDIGATRIGQKVDVWIDGRAERWQGQIAEFAGVMGRKTARSLDPTDRFDRDISEARVTLNGAMPPAMVGLRVMVGVRK